MSSTNLRDVEEMPEPFELSLHAGEDEGRLALMYETIELPHAALATLIGFGRVSQRVNSAMATHVGGVIINYNDYVAAWRLLVEGKYNMSNLYALVSRNPGEAFAWPVRVLQVVRYEG